MTLDRLLNFAARGLLHLGSPLQAYSALKMVGHWLPQRRDREDALRAAHALASSPGTCLTRALAISARTPGAEIVIGVQPAQEGVSAHAWIELDGNPLDPSAPRGDEIARLS